MTEIFVPISIGASGLSGLLSGDAIKLMDGNKPGGERFVHHVSAGTVLGSIGLSWFCEIQPGDIQIVRLQVSQYQP